MTLFEIFNDRGPKHSALASAEGSSKVPNYLCTCHHFILVCKILTVTLIFGKISEVYNFCI